MVPYGSLDGTSADIKQQHQKFASHHSTAVV